MNKSKKMVSMFGHVSKYLLYFNMSILLRKKLEASYEDYFNHLYKTYGGIPEEH